MFYLGIEMYIPQEDNIFSAPERAVFTFSDSRFRWQNRNYRDKIKDIPELSRFIGKTFNRLSLDIVNVERGLESGSAFVFKNLIRGFRVGVRIIFPDAPELNNTRLIWWGRVATVEDIDENGVRINCSQEIGDFSYELATQKYGQACPLFFGKGECLGTETLEQKSPQFQAAFNNFGQGGCNRTEGRCIELANRRFFQGQNAVTVTGQFIRDEVTTKKFLFFFTLHKHNRIPVQWSSKGQSTNSNVTIPFVYGRARIELHPFLWADIGTQIIALMGACKGQIDSFFNITSANPALTISSVTQHLGELGGVGSQQPDGRFIQAGENSRLAYLGITYDGSPPADEPEEVPSTSAVARGALIPVRNNLGQFVQEWSNNPVWITRHLITNFPYTVVKPAWFNEDKNQETANYCFTVIEDDTNAEIAVISASSYNDYQSERFRRFRSTNRIDAYALDHTRGVALTAQNELLATKSAANPLSVLSPEQIEFGSDPDVWWTSPIGNSTLGQNRTYLALRYTANLVINDRAKLTDVLHSLLLPTFRGFIRFNHVGEVEIDCRKPAASSYIRADTPIAATEIPIADAVKFSTPSGYLLIGVGKATSEIAKIKGIRFVNGFAQTTIQATASASTVIHASSEFIDRDSAPAEVYLDFSGTPTGGEKLTLQFTTPVQGDTAQNELLIWDYYIDDVADGMETVTLMFKTRLMASPSFREHFSADIFPENRTRIIIRSKTGYIQLDRKLLNVHLQGEEVLRVVEVYEDGKDEENPHGIKDNMKNFKLGVKKQDTYHGVKSTYISAVQDFRETEIQPRIAWDAAEQERNLNLLELDLRGVDNYRQAAFLNKSATIEFVDGNLYASWNTGIQGMFHEEGEVVAVRHQTMQGVSYTPFTIEELGYGHGNMETQLLGKLYFSAAFDERVAKEEKFLEASLVPNPDYQSVPPPTAKVGGYSSTGTGDGGGDIRQNILFEPQPYETFPNQQVYSPHGRDKL